MTPKKTPTLAQLRKLANRKGQEYAEVKYGNRDVHVGIHRYGSVGWWFNTWSNQMPEPRIVAFAALSALPDKKTVVK